MHYLRCYQYISRYPNVWRREIHSCRQPNATNLYKPTINGDSLMFGMVYDWISMDFQHNIIVCYNMLLSLYCRCIVYIAVIYCSIYIVYFQLYTYIHTDRQTDRQAGRQADRQTGRQADRQTGRQTDRQTDRQTYIHGYESKPSSLMNSNIGGIYGCSSTQNMVQ